MMYWLLFYNSEDFSLVAHHVRRIRLFNKSKVQLLDLDKLSLILIDYYEFTNEEYSNNIKSMSDPCIIARYF